MPDDGLRHELRNDAGRQLHKQPDADEFQCNEQIVALQQQSCDDEAEPEGIDLRQGVQARERIRKAKQADGAGHEEERAGGDRQDGNDVS